MASPKAPLSDFLAAKGVRKPETEILKPETETPGQNENDNGDENDVEPDDLKTASAKWPNRGKQPSVRDIVAYRTSVPPIYLSSHDSQRGETQVRLERYPCSDNGEICSRCCLRP